MPSAVVAHSIGAFSEGKCVFTAWRISCPPLLAVSLAGQTTSDRAELQPHWLLDTRDRSAVLALEARPGGVRRPRGGVDHRGLVDGLDLAALDQDAAIHHDQLHVARMGVVGEVLHGVE